MEKSNKIRTTILDTSGYLILLIQQLPGIWIWVPFMAAPVFLFLTTMVLNLPEIVIDIFWFSPFFEKILIVFGLVLAIYSIIYLRLEKKTGLVTTGPYRYVRHPQYTGFLFLTIGLTAWCYFLLTHTFGIGWISAEETIVLWYIELFIYIILAYIEELHLSNTYDIEYDNYKTKSSFFFPISKVGKFDLLISVLIFSFLLFGVIQAPQIM